MQWIALAGWVTALGVGLAWLFVSRRLTARIQKRLKTEYVATIANLNKKIDKLQGQRR